MTKRRRKAVHLIKSKPVIAKLPAGTILPEVQHETIVGDVLEDVITAGAPGEKPVKRRKAVQRVIRGPLVQRDEWDDPESVHTKAKKPLQRHGFRRANPVLYLSKTSPNQVTPKHVAVCELYLDDYDHARGVFGSGLDLSGVRGGSSAGGGPAEMQLVAMDTLRDVHRMIGKSGERLLLAMLVGDASGVTMTLGAYARANAMSDHTAKGRLLQVLDRLIEVYTPTIVGRVATAIAKTC